jgi:hypothetical protein
MSETLTVFSPDETCLEQVAFNEMSPYDLSYPISFLSNSLQTRVSQADSAINAIYKAISKEAPDLAEIQQATKKGVRYVVDATESTINAIESGRIKLTSEKSGQMFAQIREADGHYGSKLPIKREVFRKEVDPAQMANSLQMKALQDQVEILSEQMLAIDRSVKDVLLGQQNDRIGLYYSGVALLMESRNVNDPELKKALVAQALRSLSESTFQLSLTMQSDIQFLRDGGYNAEKKKREELIQQRMQSIHQSFAFVHQAALLRAGIYCDQGEMAAMAAVLDEYAHFISASISQNANLLAQCDVRDTGTNAGVWRSRANLRLDVSDLAKQLRAPEKTLYLGVASKEE